MWLAAALFMISCSGFIVFVHRDKRTYLKKNRASGDKRTKKKTMGTRDVQNRLDHVIKKKKRASGFFFVLLQ
jgi:hypothetical protein